MVPPTCLYLAGALVGLLCWQLSWEPVAACMRHYTCLAQVSDEASGHGAPASSLAVCSEIIRSLPPWSVLVRPQLVGPDSLQAYWRSPSAVHLAAKARPAQDDMKASRMDAERREGLLPLALTAAEAALRRAPDITGTDDEAAALARSCSGTKSVSSDGRPC